ncbi:inositol monophosphatase [Streptomyces sp. MI02-2A]|jgi:fructose-1,6-bisphosphatase/inositol monophosphatase family enzyme|uniref:inositol monophosphatase family protein n=1 Tax=unclassified Streptomyces TaxID=2593676 RepID=UPI00074104DE|nr:MULTISPECIES: inositol monophosphatase family protein [unclassified Streptomyces]KUJ38892.1 inositol monophosphatase [Streptomyces sp. NRRL F-5122]MDX3260024.1 inositol monophosphatase [Streptomyces sp. MI02-2A]REE64283.1 fructose-1,6-bisphosphatase/inositol monophosphatase family enzyme [Streptomyces sp. 3212.3]
MIDDIETIDEFLTHRSSEVAEAVRQAAAAEIMPRFRRLAEHEIDEKSGPHDLVTDADRKAEAYLTEALVKLLPGSVVVGEEAVHANPATYDAVRGDAPVWIVDPVDGTRQFVHGDPGFCTLVALAQGGVLYASWTYAPVHDRLATAVRGKGAFLDGVRLHSGSPAPDRDLEVATSHPYYTTDDQKRALLGLQTEGIRPRSCGSAGLEYLQIAQGLLDATAFSWEAAWDHAAGLLLVEEAGGAHLTLAGEPFRITGGNALPFTAARDEATARRVLGLLSGGA